MRICTVKGCNVKHQAKGLCSFHYARFVRHGDTSSILRKYAPNLHGMTGASILKAWENMRNRCLKKENPSFHRYGGRGIKICDRWLNSFENFYADMGDRPEGMEIDRRNNDGNYEPDNCRWATPRENTRNSTTAKLNTEAVKVIKYALKYMNITPKRLAEIHGISVNTIYGISSGTIWTDVVIN
jgi:hypothetical protein